MCSPKRFRSAQSALYGSYYQQPPGQTETVHLSLAINGLTWTRNLDKKFQNWTILILWSFNCNLVFKHRALKPLPCSAFRFLLFPIISSLIQLLFPQPEQVLCVNGHGVIVSPDCGWIFKKKKWAVDSSLIYTEVINTWFLEIHSWSGM